LAATHTYTHMCRHANVVRTYVQIHLTTRVGQLDTYMHVCTVVFTFFWGREITVYVVYIQIW